MRTIFKYKLGVTDHQEVEFPKNSELLSAQAQGEDIFIWAMFDLEDEDRMEKRKIRVIGTGHAIPENERLRHIGTTQMYDGKLIWHVFEVIN